MKLATKSIGRSTLGAEINCLLGAGVVDPTVLVIAGLHGDEYEGIIHCSQIIGALRDRPDLLRKIVFLPVANPDSFFLNRRWTQTGVDINRNFATADWTPLFENPRYPPGPSAASEPETRAITNFLKSSGVKFVFDLHSYKETALLPVFLEGETELQPLLEKYSSQAKIPILKDLGYAIAGGIHTWCYENGINNVTLEIEKGLGQFAIQDRYLKASLDLLTSFK